MIRKTLFILCLMFSLVLTSAYSYNMYGDGFNNPTYTTHYSSNVKSPYVNVDVQHRYVNVKYSKNRYRNTVNVDIRRDNNRGWISSLFVYESDNKKNYNNNYYKKDYNKYKKDYSNKYNNNYYNKNYYSNNLYNYNYYYNDNSNYRVDYRYYSSSNSRYYVQGCYTSPPRGKLFYKRC